MCITYCGYTHLLLIACSESNFSSLRQNYVAKVLGNISLNIENIFITYNVADISVIVLGSASCQSVGMSFKILVYIVS